MEKKMTKVDFPTLEMDTFKGILLHSVINLAHAFKSPFLNIEIAISIKNLPQVCSFYIFVKPNFT